MAGQKIPLTFGVELEFAAACLYQGEPHPYPSETRRLRFGPQEGEPSIREIKASYGLDWSRSIRYETEMYRAFFQRDLRQLLKLHDIPVFMEVTPPTTYAMWQVKEDSTVSGPPTSGYHWLDIEVVSPILHFDQRSIDEVQKVCDLIQTYYCVHTDTSTGLHVHVGRGKNGFEHEHIRKLAAFNYAFQPQLLSIVGQTRWGNIFTEDIRTTSRYVAKHYQKYGRRPLPIVAVRHFLESTEFRSDDLPRHRRSASVTEWIAKQASTIDLKYNNLNLGNMADIARGETQWSPPTVEWRLHPGTVTGERVTAWIKTVCGIVDFVCYAYPRDIYSVLSVVEHEKWEKTGNKVEDAKNLERYGPILAEGGFTAIDLFETMGLNDSAKFYADKLTVIEVEKDKLANENKTVKGHVIWEPNEGGLSVEEANDIAARKELFLTLWESGLNQNTSPKFDADDPFWPPFTLHSNRSLNTKSDASSADLGERSPPR